MKKDCYHYTTTSNNQHHCNLTITSIDPCPTECDYYISWKVARRLLKQNTGFNNMGECDGCSVRRVLGTGNCCKGGLPYFKCRSGQQKLI